jgi:hypothetical protein
MATPQRAASFRVIPEFLCGRPVAGPKPRPSTKPAPAKWLGTVQASDAEAAIKEATKQFEVKDPKRPIAIRRR